MLKAATALTARLLLLRRQVVRAGPVAVREAVGMGDRPHHLPAAAAAWAEAVPPGVEGAPWPLVFPEGSYWAEVGRAPGPRTGRKKRRQKLQECAQG